MIRNKFHKFIQFGAVADRNSRSRLAAAICGELQRPSGIPLNLSNKDTDNFGTGVSRILDHTLLHEVCAKNPELAEQITQEILDFINAAKKTLDKTESPFAMEQQLLGEFEQLQPGEFEDVWEGVGPFIQETYSRDELDPEFYTQEFRKSLVPRKRKARKKVSFEEVKEHFTEKWSFLLTRKQNSWEEQIIEEQQKAFSSDLCRRIEEMRNMEDLFNPYPGDPNRLWNITRNRLQKADFDVLNKYAEILRRDPLIQELADLLGRAQQSEADFEEAPLEDAGVEPEWLAVCTSKAEIVGIRESDDLSSILPSEAVLLAEETAELLFYKKFAEKKLQTFDYQHKDYCFREAGTRRTGWRKKETVKGPFILCIDTSGSMRGLSETIAKTLGFALLKTALRDQRACYLISFAVGIETLNLTDLAHSLDTLISFLSQSFYGGTNPMPALEEALNMLETEAYRKADLVMVSDFIMPPLDAQTQTRINRARKNKTKLHSLLVGDQNAAGINRSLLHAFDTNWVYDVEE